MRLDELAHERPELTMNEVELRLPHFDTSIIVPLTIVLGDPNKYIFVLKHKGPNQYLMKLYIYIYINFNVNIIFI